METTINQITDVEFELDIKVEHDTLEPRIDKALRERRPHVTMKGFRPGHVPISLVRRLHGKTVAYEIVDQLIQETFRSEVLDSEEHDVLGSPTITKLEYEPDGDLHAAIQFGVRPEVELADLSDEKVTHLTHEVTEDEVEQEITRLLNSRAVTTPHDGEAGEDDVVRVDLQQLDEESGTPIIGKRQEDVTFYLGGDIEEEAKKALKGTSAGDTVRFDLTHGDHSHRYEAVVKQVEARETPELDEAFVSELTKDQLGSPEELREDIRRRLESRWDEVLRERLENEIVTRMLELHPVPVPPSASDMYLESMLEEAKQESGGELPPDFDRTLFEKEYRGRAENMARWMLVRDRIVEQHGLEVENEDIDSAFAEMGGNQDPTGAAVRRMFEQQYPEAVHRMTHRIQNRKVFDWLVEQFDVVEEPWTDEREEE